MSVQRINRDSVKKILDGYVNERHSVVIKFYGANCGYCHNLAPIYKELSDSYSDIHFYAFNMEEGDGFEQKYDFHGVPTICHVETNGNNTRISFIEEPEEPDSGAEGTWYTKDELANFIDKFRRDD